MPRDRPTSNRQHVQRYRERMRRAGMRLIQMWVPDTGTAGFAEECRRQSRIASGNERLERETLEWADATRDTQEWTA